MSRNLLRDAVNNRLDEKQDNPVVQYGYLGNQTGTVSVPGKPNYVYVTMPDGMITQAYNVTVPMIARLPVVLGYDPLQRDTALLKVLSVRNVQRISIETQEVTPNQNPHHATHEWLNPQGGKDVVFVELRQFMPLRPMVVNPYKINVARGLIRVNGIYTVVGGFTVDLASYVPSTADATVSGSAVQGKYVLLSISTQSGSPVITVGTQKSIYDIRTSDIPAVPASNIPICAVFMYMRQSQIDEAANKTDLVDLRWDMFYGTSGSGGGSSGSGVVPLNHPAVAGYYITGYSNLTGSMTSGSVAHNTLPDLQGGSAGQYYHLTTAERSNIIQASGSATNGYLTSSDWIRFNSSGSGSGIPDAPSDGKLYGRKNSAWSEVPTSGSTGVIISGSGVLTTGTVVAGHIAVFSGSSGNFIQDGGAPGAGGFGIPPVKQIKAGGTSVTSITLDTVPTQGNSLLLFTNAITAQISNVACSNVTWTKLAEFTSGGSSYYSLWVGIVGASSGSVITCSKQGTYNSMIVAELATALTPSLSGSTFSNNVSFKSLYGFTAGDLILFASGADDTSKSNIMFSSPLGVGLYYGAYTMVIMLAYATSNMVSLSGNGSPGATLITKLT